MQFRFVVPVLAALALASPVAMAEDASASGPAAPHADMAKFHADMCSNHYAHAVGGMATLEVELKLTNDQKPLFERWKKVRLASAKEQSDKCANMTMPRRDMSIMDGVKLETAMLQARLDTLKAETPALEALVNSLNPDQQQTLKRAALHAMHERMGQMNHFMDHHGDRMGMMHRMHDGNPPPPPAN